MLKNADNADNTDTSN